MKRRLIITLVIMGLLIAGVLIPGVWASQGGGQHTRTFTGTRTTHP